MTETKTEKQKMDTLTRAYALIAVEIATMLQKGEKVEDIKTGLDACATAVNVIFGLGKVMPDKNITNILP